MGQLICKQKQNVNVIVWPLGGCVSKCCTGVASLGQKITIGHCRSHWQVGLTNKYLVMVEILLGVVGKQTGISKRCL